MRGAKVVGAFWKFSPEVIRQMLDLSDRGWSARQLARKFGCDRSYIPYLRKKHRRPARRWPPEGRRRELNHI